LRGAKGLQDAIGRLDEASANPSKTQLDDFLRPVKGFLEYLDDLDAERRQDVLRRFTLASGKAEKGIHFTTEFLLENFGYPNTEAMLNQKRRLESSLRAPRLWMTLRLTRLISKKDLGFVLAANSL
jgi:hypothetical protein